MIILVCEVMQMFKQMGERDREQEQKSERETHSLLTASRQEIVCEMEIFFHIRYVV